MMVSRRDYRTIQEFGACFIRLPELYFNSAIDTLNGYGIITLRHRSKYERKSKYIKLQKALLKAFFENENVIEESSKGSSNRSSYSIVENFIEALTICAYDKLPITELYRMIPKSYEQNK